MKAEILLLEFPIWEKGLSKSRIYTLTVLSLVLAQEPLLIVVDKRIYSVLEPLALWSNMIEVRCRHLIYVVVTVDTILVIEFCFVPGTFQVA